MRQTFAQARRIWTWSIAMALVALLAIGPSMVSAAATTNAWQAKIGSAGANGTAKIVATNTGTGSITLRLAKLRASTYLPVMLSKGTCSSVGSTLIKFPAIKTTSSGSAARTSTLTASQVTLIKNATNVGRIAIRIGSSTTGDVKCGLFAPLPVPPYVAATITVGHDPSGVTIAPNGVFVTNWNDNSVSRIDPVTNTVLQNLPLTISGNAGPEAIAYGEDSLWVTAVEWDANNNTLPGALLRVDPATGAQTASIPIGRGAFDVAVSPGAVWVPVSDENQVLRIDPATNTVAATIPVAGSPTGVAFGFGSVWVSSFDGHLSRIDPATNQVSATITTQDSGGLVAVSANAVWMTNVGHMLLSDGKLTRVDPATNQVTASVDLASTALGAFPLSIAAAGGSVWIGYRFNPQVLQVTEATNAIVSRLTLDTPAYDLAADAHNVWVVEQTISDASPRPLGHVVRIGY
jgi:YVTN family beta-propeller protein